MPDIEGIRLIRWLRDLGTDVRIILISGDPVGAFGNLAAKLATVNRTSEVKVLAKPCRVAELPQAIDGTEEVHARPTA